MTTKSNKLYHVWITLKHRTENPDYAGYKHYGARGITNLFESYEEFKTWALSAGYKEGLYIDRVNNDGPYSKYNCRWVTNKVNSNNRRTNIKVQVDGKEMTVTEACELLGIERKMVYRAVHGGMWPSEQEYIDFMREVKRDSIQ